MTKKQPWGPSTPWKDSVAFFTYLRGCLRSAWSRNPIKHELLKKTRKQIENPKKTANKPTVWGCTCAMCGQDHVMRNIQVDHIVEAGSLRRTEDIQGFVERLLYVTEADLRVVCKECNSALAYASKHGLSFVDARATKAAIKIIKEKQDLTTLESYGIIPGRTQKARREQLIQILSQEYGFKEQE
jgi:hypothetical protein